MNNSKSEHNDMDLPINAHMSDSQIIDWLEEQAKKSRTGISFDWAQACDGDPSGFRFMRRHFIGGSAKTLREAVKRAKHELRP